MIKSKFRIFDVKNDCYLIENSIFDKQKVLELFAGIIDFENNAIEIRQREEDYPLLQCLNIKDKNGKEIYEGHILKCTWKNDKEVEYGIALYDLDSLDGLPAVEIYRKHTFNIGLYLRDKEVEVEIVGDALKDKKLMEYLEEIGDLNFEIYEQNSKGLNTNKLKEKLEKIKENFNEEIEKIKKEEESNKENNLFNLYHSLSESRGDLLSMIEVGINDLSQTEDINKIKSILKELKEKYAQFGNYHRSLLNKIRDKKKL